MTSNLPDYYQFATRVNEAVIKVSNLKGLNFGWIWSRNENREKTQSLALFDESGTRLVFSLFEVISPIRGIKIVKLV